MGCGRCRLFLVAGQSCVSAWGCVSGGGCQSVRESRRMFFRATFLCLGLIPPESLGLVKSAFQRIVAQHWFPRGRKQKNVSVVHAFDEKNLSGCPVRYEGLRYGERRSARIWHQSPLCPRRSAFGIDELRAQACSASDARIWPELPRVQRSHGA